MKKFKKFCAFALATTMVAGAVYYVTPAMKALADTTVHYLKGDDKYAEVGEGNYKPTGYTFYVESTTYVEVEEVNTWIVTLKPGAGTGSDITLNVTDGDSITLPKCEFTTPTGYTGKSSFYGWESNGNFYGTIAPVTITKNTTFTATWWFEEFTPIADKPGYHHFHSDRTDGFSEDFDEKCFYIKDGVCLDCGWKQPSGSSSSSSELSSEAQAHYEPWEASKQNATPSGSSSSSPELSSEAQANYEAWLATWGGGSAAGAGEQVVEGTPGQPGSEVILNNNPTGAPVTMFQATDASQTLLAAPVGAVPTGTKFATVEAGANTPEFRAAQNAIRRISRRGNVAKVFAISATTKDGVQVTSLGGKAAISLPMPQDITIPNGQELHVYEVTDGQAERLESLTDAGRIVCGTEKLGTFAFVVERPSRR